MDTDPGFMSIEVVLFEKANVVAGHDWQIESIGQYQRGFIPERLLTSPGTRQFQIQAFGKPVSVTIKHLFCGVFVMAVQLCCWSSGRAE